jgi:hypothetical protein
VEHGDFARRVVIHERVRLQPCRADLERSDHDLRLVDVAADTVDSGLRQHGHEIDGMEIAVQPLERLERVQPSRLHAGAHDVAARVDRARFRNFVEDVQHLRHAGAVNEGRVRSPVERAGDDPSAVDAARSGGAVALRRGDLLDVVAHHLGHVSSGRCSQFVGRASRDQHDEQ